VPPAGYTLTLVPAASGILDAAGNALAADASDAWQMTPPPPGAVTLAAAADAYVRDGTYAGQNFGPAGELQLKKSGSAGSTREAYLRFDLAGVSSVGSAKLRLFGRIDSSTERPGVAVYSAANTTWGESAITWNTRPASGAAALATATVATSTPQWYEWDVTQYLASHKAAGATAVTLVVRSLAATTPYLMFASGEAAANAPELAVTPPARRPRPSCSRATSSRCPRAARRRPT
jgi:hypothetical protein